MGQLFISHNHYTLVANDCWVMNQIETILLKKCTDIKSIKALSGGGPMNQSKYFRISQLLHIYIWIYVYVRYALDE